MKLFRFILISAVCLGAFATPRVASADWGWRGGWHGGWGGPRIGIGFYGPGPYYYGPGPYYYDSYYYGPYYAAPAVVDHGVGVEVAVQRALAHRGYYGGPIDGAIGAQSRAAIRAYQVDKGLPVSGHIDGPLLRSLGL